MHPFKFTKAFKKDSELTVPYHTVTVPNFQNKEVFSAIGKHRFVTRGRTAEGRDAVQRDLY